MKTYATLHDIQRDLQQGILSCTELVQYHLARIDAHQHVNAFLSIYRDEALQQAAGVDKKIKQNKAGKLAGLIVSLKDVFSHLGHPLQASSKILDGFIAQYNATIVERLLREDAIIIGRTNCDEFGMGSSTENSAYGVTRNPLDLGRVPGGSSGGAAAAVQADLCRISIGSDTGGSVRQPAAFCGVIGLKPTYSRISRYGLVAYASSFDCVGILGKSLDDIALVLHVIAGADDHDSTVSQLPVPDYGATLHNQSPPTFRIACLGNALNSEAVHEEIRSALSQQVQHLENAGHQVDVIDFPLLEYALPAYYILATAEASTNLSRYDGVRFGHRSSQAKNPESLYKKSRSEGFGKEVQRRILLGTFVLSSDYYDSYFNKAQQVRRILRDQIRKIFLNYDFIILPTTPTPAFKFGERNTNPLEMYLGDLFSVPANVTGIPAISIPCGTDKSGLPIGLQVMANDFEEAKLFQFGSQMLNFKHK